MSNVYLGTSGWSYADWVGPLYPPGTPSARYLQMYAAIFRSVEIDSTFYGIPTLATPTTTTRDMRRGLCNVCKHYLAWSRSCRLPSSRVCCKHCLPVRGLSSIMLRRIRAKEEKDSGYARQPAALQPAPHRARG